MNTIDKTVISKSQPKQTNVCWIDTSGGQPVQKYFINGSWSQISSQNSNAMPIKNVGTNNIVYPNIFYYFGGKGQLTLDTAGVEDGVFNEFVILSNPSGKSSINSEKIIYWADNATPSLSVDSLEEIHVFVINGQLFGWFREYSAK